MVTVMAGGGGRCPPGRNDTGQTTDPSFDRPSYRHDGPEKTIIKTAVIAVIRYNYFPWLYVASPPPPITVITKRQFILL